MLLSFLEVYCVSVRVGRRVEGRVRGLFVEFTLRKKKDGGVLDEIPYNY